MGQGVGGLGDVCRDKGLGEVGEVGDRGFVWTSPYSQEQSGTRERLGRKTFRVLALMDFRSAAGR